MKKKRIYNIGDTDENADWIKTPENRESERRIHDELAKQLKAKKAKDQTQAPAIDRLPRP